jgi:cell division protease FtsH
VIARGTPGFSGADLANIVNEAALLAARSGKRMVSMVDFESAKDKVMMGAERRSMVMTEDEKRLTAYHEAGHAIVGCHSAASDPIHKATIIPRGPALGMVMRLPEGDRISVSREKLNADIAVAMGGRVAEELIFGHEKVTAGAASDIEQATKIARHMVTHWGMSDELGPMSYGENQQEVFLGHSITQTKNVSEATAQTIDSEIHKIVDEGYSSAWSIISNDLDKLHDLANALLEHETLTGEEINAVLRGEPLPKSSGSSDVPPSATAPSGGKRGSVPTTAPPKDAPGGMEPSPQPGA